jgi:phosphomannomutase
MCCVRKREVVGFDPSKITAPAQTRGHAMTSLSAKADTEPYQVVSTVEGEIRELLRKEPGATVLHNLICSRVVPETIERNGGKPLRTRVGHSFIKQRMAETAAVFAVEHSGHYYFRDNFRADSGLIATLLLLEALSAADEPLSAAVAPYDIYAQSGEVNFEVDDQEAVLDRVAEQFDGRGEVDWADGLTVDLGAGWFNLRPSNT